MNVFVARVGTTVDLQVRVISLFGPPMLQLQTTCFGIYLRNGFHVTDQVNCGNHSTVVGNGELEESPAPEVAEHLG